MLRRRLSLMALALAAMPLVPRAARAGDNDPLFINATTDDGRRMRMALAFAQNQLERKHPITIFLNDRGVLVGAAKNKDRFEAQQAMLATLIAGGATVLICPMCMEHYGVKSGDLLPNVRVGNPDVTGAALFKDNTKTLTW